MTSIVAVEPIINGVCFVVTNFDAVLLEQCPKKARVLGVGEWFVPGGKVEPGETPIEALAREIEEELGPLLLNEQAQPLPIVEGSAVPPGPKGIFLMRPYRVKVRNRMMVPGRTIDGGIPLRWFSRTEALHSPVPQVRMMVAAALP